MNMLLSLGGVVLLLATTHAAGLDVANAAGVEREPRWYSRDVRTITKVVRQRQTITESTPSSCVVVQTSLPACRHIRAVDQIQPTQTVGIMATEAPVPKQGGWKPILQPSDPTPPKSLTKATPTPTPATGWGWDWDFFNFGGPKHVTVTRTLTDIQTRKYLDPNTVVTFSVKGCRPSRLPFDLPECQPPTPITEPPAVSIPEPEAPERGVIVMAPIQFIPPAPMPNVDAKISPDKALDDQITKKENLKESEGVEEVKNIETDSTKT